MKTPHLLRRRIIAATFVVFMASSIVASQVVQETATPQDKNLLAAQAAFAEAELARSQKRRPDAIRKYEEALQLYRAAADRKGETATLNILAAGYQAIGEKQKSLDRYDQLL